MVIIHEDKRKKKDFCCKYLQVTGKVELRKLEEVKKDEEKVFQFSPLEFVHGEN